MEDFRKLRLLYAGTIPCAEVMYQFGAAVLAEHLRTVAFFLRNGTSNSLQNGRNRMNGSVPSQYEITQSVMFINGTGLDLVVEQFGLGINPMEFRETFYGWLEKKGSGNGSCRNRP